MITPISTWLDRDVYPAIFTQAVQFFPEFDFRRTSGNWISNTALKADGTQGNSTGKVYFYANRKHCLTDFRLNASVTLWDYFKRREGLISNGDIVRFFSDLTGIPLPETPKSTPTTGKPPQKGVHPAILQTAHRFMQQALQEAEAAEPVRQYLQGRGYSPDEIQAMQLGFLPSLEALRSHLEGQRTALGGDYAQKRIDYFMRKLNVGKKTRPELPIGKSHSLAIPCFGAQQRLAGFSFRSLVAAAGDKYINMAGLTKSVSLLDFPHGTECITAVEGIFDGKVAQARGLTQVVPLNGTHLAINRVQEMMGQGMQRLTLCLDNDAPGLTATYKIADKVLKQCPELRVFVAQLPDGIKDPDELMREQGVETFQSVIDQAESLGAYRAGLYKQRIDNYTPEDLTAKKRADFVTHCREVGALFTWPMDRADFYRVLRSARPEVAGLFEEEPIHKNSLQTYFFLN